MDYVSSSLPDPHDPDDYSTTLLRAIAAPTATILFADDARLTTPGRPKEDYKRPMPASGSAICTRHGGAVVGWNYFASTVGPLHASALRLRMYSMLGIPLHRPRPDPLRVALIDRGLPSERRGFLNIVRLVVARSLRNSWTCRWWWCPLDDHGRHLFWGLTPCVPMSDPPPTLAVSLRNR